MAQCGHLLDGEYPGGLACDVAEVGQPRHNGCQPPRPMEEGGAGDR